MMPSMIFSIVKGTTLAFRHSSEYGKLMEGQSGQYGMHRFETACFAAVYISQICGSSPEGILLSVVAFDSRPHGLWRRQGFSSDLAGGCRDLTEAE
jgi:hypothetical protein